MSNEGFTVTVNNWDEYQPRKDIQKHSWFRVDNNLFFSQKTFDLSPNDFCLLLFLLAMCSNKQSTGTISLKYDYVRNYTRLNLDDIKKSLVKLEENQIVKCSAYVDVRGRSSAFVDVLYTTLHNTTEHNRTEQENTSGGGLPPAPPTEDEKDQKTQVKSLRSKKKQASESGEVWGKYCNAFFARYGTEPVRNATVNSQMAAFVKRVGMASAPAIVEFYLQHPDRWYVKNMHSVGLLLRDAEKLYAEWKTGNAITHGGAIATESSSYYREQLARLSQKGN